MTHEKTKQLDRLIGILRAEVIRAFDPSPSHYGDVLKDLSDLVVKSKNDVYCPGDVVSLLLAAAHGSIEYLLNLDGINIDEQMTTLEKSIAEENKP